MARKSDNPLVLRLLELFDTDDLKQVANILGEKYPSLHNWATGRRDFPTEVLIKIAKMTNVDLNWLLTGTVNVTEDAKSITFEATMRTLITEIVKEEVDRRLTDKNPSVKNASNTTIYKVQKNNLPKAETSLTENSDNPVEVSKKQ